MDYQNIREEELKNKIADDYFQQFDCTKIVGNIDFCVTIKIKDVLHFESVAHLNEKELFEKDGLYLEGGVHLKAKVFSPKPLQYLMQVEIFGVITTQSLVLPPLWGGLGWGL